MGEKRGTMWGLNAKDLIYHRNSVTDKWKNIPSRPRQISAGDMGVFGVNDSGVVFRRGTHKNPNSPGTGWQRITGALKYISSGTSGVIGVGRDDKIYRMTNITFKGDSLGPVKWVNIPNVGNPSDGIKQISGKLQGCT